MPRIERNIYTAIEIGTATIKVALAEVLDDDGTINLLALNEKPSHKMLKGEAVTPSIVTDGIRQTIDQTLRQVRLNHIPEGPVVVVASGRAIEVKRASCTQAIENNRPINADDVELLMNSAGKNLPMPLPGRYRMPDLLDSVFSLDNGQKKFNPIGYISPSLTLEQLYGEADISYITQLQGLVAPAIHGRKIDFISYAPLAVAVSACAPSRNDDSQSLVIDVGAGMTSYAITSPLSYMDLGQIALGCDHIANDINIGLGINDIDTARVIVRDLDHLRCSAIATHDSATRCVALDLRSSGIRMEFSSEKLETIIEARLTEIFDVVREKLVQNQTWKYVTNEILLSGGIAMIPRIMDLATQVLGHTVRAAVPLNISSANAIPHNLLPRYNALLGAVRYAHRSALIADSNPKTNCTSRIVNAVKDWIDNFL